MSEGNTNRLDRRSPSLRPSMLLEAEGEDLEAFLPFCLLENLADAVVAQTMDGRIASWNPAAERLFGYTAQEIKGKPFSILLPPEVARELSGLLKKIWSDQRVDGF